MRPCLVAVLLKSAGSSRGLFKRGGGSGRGGISHPGEKYNVCPQVCRDTLSGPVLRDTARLSQQYPPTARYGVFGVSTRPIGCDTPSPFSEHFPLGEHAKWRCDTPPQKGYLSDTCAIPYENKQTRAIPPSAILSQKGIARYGGAAKVTPGPSRECDITFFQKGQPKSARELRDSTVAARRVQSVTVPSSQVSR